MEKINPLLYITDDDPVDEVVLSTSGWFDTETMNLTLNAVSGSEFVMETLAWYAAQGWKIISETSWVQSGSGWFTGSSWNYVGIKMQRRYINSEKALKTLIGSYTSAYNEGRSLNDQRYDDIIALYAVLIDKSEDDLNDSDDTNTVFNDTVFNDMIEQIMADMEADNISYTTEIEGDFDGYGESQRLQINSKFYNKSSSERSELVSRGMYNSTVWDSTRTGLTREHTFALLELDDRLEKMRLDLETLVYSRKLEMRKAFLDAYNRLRSLLLNTADRKLAMRNAIIQALLDFMERRTDSYPDMSDIGKLAANLGTSSPSVPL